MPRQLALLICILLILYLFLVDRKKIEGVSRAIWIPIIWMFLGGSRYVSKWLNLSYPVTFEDAYIDGSPVDRAIFTVLMVAAATILIRRRLNWRELFIKNKWMWIFFIFSALSILWSDYPFVSFKRWDKALGNAAMALLILTEQCPYEAFGVILRRIAFVILPLSVLFIKYYPNLGRAYHGGFPMAIGVTGQKNSLGQICMISFVYFAWEILLNRRNKIKLGQGLPLSIYIIMLPMIVWLLFIANSATSLVCTGIAVSLLLVSRMPAMVRSPRRILMFSMACIVLYGMCELSFGISKTMVTMIGRRPDLTTRVPMWHDLLAMVKNPLIGFGYGSFWLGDRQMIISETWGISGQAHNGYLQVYLDIGIIGLFITLAWILSGLRNIAIQITTDYNNAIIRLCFIVIVVVYNWTEATFYGVSNMWILFMFGSMDIYFEKVYAN